MVMVMASNIVGIQAAPFDPDTYEEGGPQNLIRWRHVRRPDGTMGVESNARMVRWSDGSLHLLLGAEVLATDIKSMQHDKAHLFVRHPKGQGQGQGKLLEKMRFRPFDTHSLIHKKLTLGLDSLPLLLSPSSTLHAAPSPSLSLPLSLPPFYPPPFPTSPRPTHPTARGGAGAGAAGGKDASIVTTGDPEKEKEDRERVRAVACQAVSQSVSQSVGTGATNSSFPPFPPPSFPTLQSIQQQIRTKETLRQEQEKRARKYSNQPQQRAARDREQQRYGGGYRQQVCGVLSGAVGWGYRQVQVGGGTDRCRWVGVSTGAEGEGGGIECHDDRWRHTANFLASHEKVVTTTTCAAPPPLAYFSDAFVSCVWPVLHALQQQHQLLPQPSSQMHLSLAFGLCCMVLCAMVLWWHGFMCGGGTI
ncbi:unnamed protein product [Closterium sp. NIES-54]